MTTHEPRPSSIGTLPVIAPRGEFDIDNLAPLETQTETVSATHSGLVLDASGITFADSMFLRLILATHKRTGLRIAAPAPTVTRLFGVVDADTFLHIHSTVEAARGLIRPRAA
ncbi:STAS domain-containing protein [Streptomyces sp. NPDC012389]|uniref:STAS domain-containing protein n=1 Tax=Streptomyces sp. NPDC012389 TaxID=3364830 RepID=UPI0036E7FAAB